MPPGLVLPLLQRDEWAELQSTPFGERLHFYVGRTPANTGAATAGTAAESSAGVGAAVAAAVGVVAPPAASAEHLSACEPTTPTVLALGSTLAAMGDESAGLLEWVANNFAIETAALALVALALVKVATTETAYDVKKRKEREARERRR